MKTKTKNSLCFLALLCAGFLLPFTGNAQVTIGSDKTPAKAALLDVKDQNAIDAGGVTATKGGIILPRVALTGLNSLAPFISGGGTATDKATHKGMVVYNLTDDATFTPGMYYWDGNQWLKAQNTAAQNTYTGSNSIEINSNNEIIRKALSGDVTAAANNNTLTIADNAVTSAKIQNGTIITDDLADFAVTTTKIAADAVTSEKIKDGTIATVDLANNAVSTAKIAANAVNTTKIARQGTAGQVLTSNGTGADVSWQTISVNDADAIVGNEVTNATSNRGLERAGNGTTAAPYTLGIADYGVTTDLIAANAVTSSKIADGTIVNDDIQNTTITAAKLLAQGEPGQVLTIQSNGAAPIWASASSMPTQTGTSTVNLKRGSGPYVILLYNKTPNAVKSVTVTGKHAFGEFSISKQPPYGWDRVVDSNDYSVMDSGLNHRGWIINPVEDCTVSKTSSWNGEFWVLPL